MKLEKEQLLDLLRPIEQQHLLAFWDALDERGRMRLAEQIRGIDFTLVDRLLRKDEQHEDWHATAMRAEPPPAFRLGAKNEFSRDEAAARGEQALRSGKLAVALVAGGQGTRLGFPHPKGLFPIGPVSRATLFQILFEKIAAVGRRYGVRLALYLMTSPATHDETLDFLEGHNYFGLARDDVKVFCQGTMPAVDAASGKLLLASHGELSLSPDGHGGMLAALAKSGGFADMQARGVEQLFYMQVDNPLVGVCDPEFIGYHLLAKSEVSTQVVAKRDALERVGNVATVDGKMRIIEYSDLPEQAARRTAPDGTLLLWAGNIAVHVFDVAFLTRVQSSDATRLPFHIARKKVPFVDAEGQLIEPDQPNAVKFEQFIFDLLPAARHSIVMEVDARTSFAPIKNAAGSATDAPEHAQSQMIALHRSWLEQAGASVADGVPVEISPLAALDAADLAGTIQRGTRITEPLYLR